MKSMTMNEYSEKDCQEEIRKNNYQSETDGYTEQRK